MRLEHESPREAHTDALTRILRTYSGAHGHARARVQPRNANVSYITARDAQRRAHTCEHVLQSETGKARYAARGKSYANSEPSYQYGDDYGKTTETISLWVMFEGDLRPTRLTSNQTTYTWDSYSPDFTLKHGDTTIAASDAYLYPDEDSSWYRY